MATYGDVFLEDYRASLDALSRLSHDTYTDQDVRDLASKIGMKTELYLKSTVLPAKNPRDNFVSFINDLSYLGVDQNHIVWFHDLRQIYNKAKHDPNAQVTLIETTEVVQNAQKTAKLIVANSLGDSVRRVRSTATRIYWIAAFDHYIDGDTEIHIIIPGESEHWLGPPTSIMSISNCWRGMR